MSPVQAEIIDSFMIKAEVYTQPCISNCLQSGHEIPAHVLKQLQQIFSLQHLQSDEFLSIQSVMDSLDAFCFSAPEFLHPATFRIISLSFENRFNLHELNDHIDDIRLLYRHAEEQSHLLGFVRLMNRDSWHRVICYPNAIFWKIILIYGKKVAKLPLFDCHRVVNWLFKQPAEILDWLSSNIQHSSVRVAATALSFIDTHHIHPQIVLATLQYFQYIAARLFIDDVHQYALQHCWFEHERNRTVVLKGKRQAIEDHRIAISPSILYLDEWIGLLRDVVAMDDQITKRVYANLSRVMQAYMQHLYKITCDLPEDVLAYIRPQTQQDRNFITCYNVTRFHL